VQNRELELAGRPAALVEVPCRTSGVKQIEGMLRAALLTLALSLPQGLLALPVAVARTGLGEGLRILALVGLLNVVTVAWTARLVARSFASGTVTPSLTALAPQGLGPGGRVLATASSATLFFLALLASLVGLGHSLAAVTGGTAPTLALSCGLLALGLAQRRAPPVGGGASFCRRGNACGGAGLLGP
jgi:hypothetical protein